MNLKKWIFIAIFLTIFYFVFIVNFFIAVSIIIALYLAFKIYKFNSKRKLNKLINSKEAFKKSELGLFISLVAKVAKADGRVHELEAQLIGMMFDDISKVFNEKDKARAIMKEIFNEEKEKLDNTLQLAQELNTLLGRSILKRRQFIGFLIQLAFVDNGISKEEDEVLQIIAKQLNISSQSYQDFVNKFENMKNSKPQTMSLDEAYKVLGVNANDDMSKIKKVYRQLVRQYHPDIISSQNKDESYIEEATAKTQEINQAYQVIKESKN